MTQKKPVGRPRNDKKGFKIRCKTENIQKIRKYIKDNKL